MTALAETLLRDYLWLAVAGLLGLALLVVWLLLRLAKRTRGRSELALGDLDLRPEETAEAIDLTAPPPRSDLRRSFSRARGAIRRAFPGIGASYRRPWVLALGRAMAGKTTLLGRSRLGLPYGQPRQRSAPDHPGVNWWAFDGGVVLDVAGEDLLRPDGLTSDRAEWLGILRRVRRSRPRRPIDGVVLTLPVSDLLADDKPQAQLAAEAARRGTLLQRKLAEAGRVLGMQFPVYLVVSHCDRIPGFAAVVPPEGSAARQQMLGWSNPASPTSPYSGAWIDRAFETIHEELDVFQLRSLAAGGPSDEDAVLFPNRFQKLSAPLRVYANHLFAPGADSEPPLLRGLYFCGGGDPDASEVLFVGDLLHRKVFPEAALALPTERARGRARIWRAALAALILGGVFWALAGLDWGLARVRPAVATAPPLLAEIESGLPRPGATGAAAPAALDEPAREIVEAAAGVESFRVRSVALPASWWPSGLQGGVGRSVTAGLERVVFPALRSSLAGRAQLLTRLPRSRTPPPRNGDVIRITAYPEFQDLEEFSKELEDLDRLVGLYQRFSSQGPGARLGAIEDFNRLSGAILGERLQLAPPEPRPFLGWAKPLAARRIPPFDVNARPWPAAYWSRWLAALRVRPFDLTEKEHENLQAEATARAERFFSAVFERNPLAWDLDQILVDWIDGGPLWRPRPAEVDSYRRLRASLARTRSHLELPEVQWTAADRADLGERFDAILRRFHESRLLGRASDDEIKRRAVEEFRHLQRGLESYKIDDTGPLLVREDARWRLSPEIAVILAGLDRIFEEPFMQRHCEAVAMDDRAIRGSNLFWKAEPLESALALVAAYESWDGDLAEFLKAQGLEELPKPLRGTEPQVTAQAIGDNVVCLIAEAQSFTAAPATEDPVAIEADIKLQVQGLQAVEKTLEDLLAALGRLELRGRQAQLAGILRDQRIHILEQLDRLLARQRLYVPAGGDFGAWQGEPGPALVAFGAAGADELGDYLKTARGVARRLSSEYAQPLLAMFAESGQLDLVRPVPAAASWRRIGADLAAYEDKQAGNPLGRLEDFVVKIAGQEEPELFDLYTCFSALAPAAGGAARDDDFFLKRRAELRALLLGRCRQLADKIGFEKYVALARIHDERLWSRFPFAPKEAPVDADPEALRAFFGPEFRRTLLLVRNLPEESVWFKEGKDEAREFMERMEKVRLFFASYLSPETEGPPVFDLQVRFRIERTREQGANQIIEWLLDLGEGPEKGPIDLLSTRSVSGAPETPATTEPDGRWVFGRPVTLTFRWAKNSPFAPHAPAEARPAERWTIRDRTLQIRYREPWALLRLLAEYRAPAVEFPELRDPEPETVKLSIVTVSGDRPEPRVCADVYLRLTLLSPEEEKARLAVPEFPRERAPLVERPVPLLEPETGAPAEVIGAAAGLRDAPGSAPGR